MGIMRRTGKKAQRGEVWGGRWGDLRMKGKGRRGDRYNASSGSQDQTYLLCTTNIPSLVVSLNFSLSSRFSINSSCSSISFWSSRMRYLGRQSELCRGNFPI